MTRFGWAVLVGFVAVLLIIPGGITWYRAQLRAPAPSVPAAQKAAEVNVAELSLYSSGEYGFSLVYPARATVIDAFSTSTGALPWRVHAQGSGTPVVAIRMPEGEVRVGVSADAKEVASCGKAGSSETKTADARISSTTWQRFTSEKLGTDDERQVVSYRTVHDARCYALELLTPLGATATSTGYTLEQTVTSFTFAQ